MGLFLGFAVLLGLLCLSTYHYWHIQGHGPNMLAWGSLGTLAGTFFLVGLESGVLYATLLLIEAAVIFWLLHTFRVWENPEPLNTTVSEDDTPEAEPMMVDNPDGAYFLVLDGEYSLSNEECIDALRAYKAKGWVLDTRGEYMVWRGDQRVGDTEVFWRGGKTYIPIMWGEEE